LDIWFRKIDWNSDLIYDGLELYGSGKEWFEIKQEIIDDMSKEIKDKKYNPKTIKEEYIKYWWDLSSDDTDDFSLKNEYYKVCNEVNLSNAVKSWYFDKITFTSSNSSLSYIKFEEKCESLANDKTKSELLFISWIMKLNGPQMLNNNLTDYINNSFFKRVQDLSSIFEQVYTNSAKFNQRVIKQVTNCK
jgi:hypothetical protein